MTDFKPIVAMVEFDGDIMVATPDGVYKMVNGKPILVAGQEDFRRADEEWDRKRRTCNECEGVGTHTGECVFYGQR